MIRSKIRRLSLQVLGLACLSAASAFAQPISVSNALVGTAIRYQGILAQSNYPASGNYQFRFQLFDDPVATNISHKIGACLQTNLLVSNGLFSAVLDFGDGVFTGRPLHLDVGVRPTDANTNFVNFTTLTPRNPILAVPYALWARMGGSEVLSIPPDDWYPYFANLHLFSPGPGPGVAWLEGSFSQNRRFYFQLSSNLRKVERLQFWLNSSSFSLDPLPDPLSIHARFEVWRTVTLNPNPGVAHIEPRFDRLVSSPVNIRDTSQVGQWLTAPLLPDADLILRPGEFLVVVFEGAGFGECYVRPEAIVSSYR